MKSFDWDPDKNTALRVERGVSFEDIVFHILMGNILDVYEHPNQLTYPGQKIFKVLMDGYVFLVPFVESNENIFLKTIIPSRKATRLYHLSEQQGDSRKNLKEDTGVTSTMKSTDQSGRVFDLDAEEDQILREFNSDGLQSSGVSVEALEHYKKYAEATFRKDARINIRISTRDLQGLQKKAMQEGIPYQTLISSVLHKYVEGRLQER